jgi:hypothetical protein
MKIVVISGDGSGAGKTTLAETLGGNTSSIWSLAGTMRMQLQQKYPDYDWFNTTQKHKETTIVDDYRRGYTMREAMLEYGSERCKFDKNYWVARLVDRLQRSSSILGGPAVYVDDLRKVDELNFFKMKFPDVLHFHVECDTAKPEPMFDNPMLKNLADYVVSWKK